MAEDAQLDHYRRHPEHNDGDWLAEQFEVLRTTDAGTLLFDHEHNPMYWVPISHDAAKVLVAFWRRTDGKRLRHDFTDPDWDTRFLGDLYQDLSEHAKKTLRAAADPGVRRGVHPRPHARPGDRGVRPRRPAADRPGLRVAGTSCSARSAGCWTRGGERAGLDDSRSWPAARSAAVHGVDLNPFAVAIARFRLLVAAMKAGGVRTLADGRRTSPIHVAVGDSLLHGRERQAVQRGR